MTTGHWHGTADELEQQFDVNADRYDLMVGLNRGYHEHLHSAARTLADHLSDDRPVTLLDLGCGSGASTVAVLAAVGAEGKGVEIVGVEIVGVEIVGVDASDGMLAQARGKTWPSGVSFRHGRAEDVADRAAEWGVPVPVDGIFAAYLCRNVADGDAALAAAHAVLAPGGWLVTQEYSVAGSRRAAAVWSFVCWTVIVPLGLVLTRRTALYRYLWRSVLHFDSPARFVARLEAAGFVDVSAATVPGWQRGILHTFSARRPTLP